MSGINNTDVNIDEAYLFALQLGKDAGQMVMDAAQRRMAGDGGVSVEKENAVDLVTKTDTGMFSMTLFWSLFWIELSD